MGYKGRINVADWFADEEPQKENQIEPGNPERAEAARVDRVQIEELQEFKKYVLLRKRLRKAESDMLKEKEKSLEKEKKMRLGSRLGTAGKLIAYRWMEKLASASTIISSSLGILVKLLGLLIDVILLPFLPIIVMGLMLLANAIIALNKTISGGSAAGAANGNIMPSIGGVSQDVIFGLVEGILVALAAALLGASAGWAIVAGVITAVLTKMAYDWAFSIGDAFGQAMKDRLLPTLDLISQLVNSFRLGLINLKDWWDQLYAAIYNGLIDIYNKVISLPGISQVAGLAGVSPATKMATPMSAEQALGSAVTNIVVNGNIWDPEGLFKAFSDVQRKYGVGKY